MTPRTGLGAVPARGRRSAGFDRRLRLLLARPRVAESGREPVGAVARVMQWWAESDQTERAGIEQAVIGALQGLARSTKGLTDAENARLLVLLAQLVVELNLDERARNLLWSIAQRGRISGDTGSLLPPDSERYLLAWLAVIQLDEWLPLWRRLWNGTHSDLWPIAFGAMINVVPEEAAAQLPKLLERRETIGAERCGRLLFRLLQRDIPWPKVVERWWACGALERDAASLTRIAAQVNGLVSELIEISGSAATRAGLQRFRTSLTQQAGRMAAGSARRLPYLSDEDKKRIRAYNMLAYGDGGRPTAPQELPIPSAA